MSGHIRPGWSFVIVAGGSGTRLGGTPKQFRLLGGIPVWQWSLRAADALRRDGHVDQIVVVMPEDKVSLFARADADDIVVVSGGATRARSVRNGVLAADRRRVMIHDAARPFVGKELCLRLMEHTERIGAAIPVIRSSDALKSFANGVPIVLDRDQVFRTQTPQCFERAPILDILKEDDADLRDEASAWIERGREIAFVEGDSRNFKITDSFDWEMAVSIAESSAERRTGIGYDVHELVPGRALILCGIRVSSPLGLLGHSDADIVSHTVSDALLGAAGEPDIGMLFPAGSDEYKDADSMELLRRAYNRIKAHGWRAVWVDVVLTAQVPRLGRYTAPMADALSKILSDDGAKRANIKIKSGEHVGSVGRAECMQCYAVAQIERYRDDI